MATLIAMAVYDTVENKRTDLTLQTLVCLADTVDLSRHRVIISDNGSCAATQRLYKSFPQFKVIYNGENLGTAGAVNLAWAERRPDEYAVKMDNDVIIHTAGWVDEMEEAMQRGPEIGILGLKRIDCWEHPYRDDAFKSEIRLLPPYFGHRWIAVEKVNHVMGTCQMYSPELLEKIGYLYQPRLYGFDDSLAAIRCRVAGFESCFLPHIRIDHIDPGDTPYQTWKHKVSSEDMAEYNRMKEGYISGQIPIYYDPFKYRNA
jgi:GT2 family glycosyltransferase